MGDLLKERAGESRTAAPRLGAWVEPGPRVRWRVWAPGHRSVEVVLHDAEGNPGACCRWRPSRGAASAPCWRARAPGVRYKLRVDGEGPFPDPWSRSQPHGRARPLRGGGAGLRLDGRGLEGAGPRTLVIYEVHVGTATPEGTFEALIPRLTTLRELGVNALELMPLASFPGTRNWGYDGVDLFAPRHVYGGPEGLRRLDRRRARARARRAHRRRLQPLRAGRELPALLLAALLHRPPPHALGRRHQLRRRAVRARARAGALQRGDVDPRLPRGRPAAGRRARHRG